MRLVTQAMGETGGAGAAWAFTPTWPASAPPDLAPGFAAPVTRRHPTSQPKRERRIRTTEQLLCQARRPTPLIMGTRVRRRCTGWRTHPVDLAAFMIDHGDGTGQPGLVEPVLEGHPPGELTRDDILDNITLYWLTNTGISTAASLLGEQGRLLPKPQNISQTKSRLRLSVFPERALPGASELGGAGIPKQPDPLQQARQRRALRRLGTASTLFRGDAGGLQVTARSSASVIDVVADPDRARCSSRPSPLPRRSS